MIALPEPIRMFAALAVVAALAACGAAPDASAPRAPVAEAPAALNITSINVTVPRTLKVSEKNRYYPGGDIVWRGDPSGDRYAQVEAIFRDAMARGTQGMTKGTPAVLDIEVERFHALTEKARYSTGGVHAITFLLTLRDPATGQVLAAPRRIKADLRAYGGQAAIAADQRGETQKVRITVHLAYVIRTELSNPGSYQGEGLGLIGALNTL
ncbi:MAG TPA: DUF6778 family protein [Roseovarius sp.]